MVNLKIYFRNIFLLKELKFTIKKKSVHIIFITSALKKSIKEKDRLERLAKKWPLTYGKMYKQYRNNLTTLLRTAKNKYYKDQLKENQGNPKNHWHTINTLLGRTNTSNNKQTINLKPFCDNAAATFNDLFLRFNNLTSDDDGNDFMSYLKNSPQFSMYLPPVSKDEIENYLNGLKSTSPGHDDISPKLLKCSSSIIYTPLLHIINICLKFGYFPDHLKTAKVLPLHKSGDRHDITNYRPISILPAFSKLLEKS